MIYWIKRIARIIAFLSFFVIFFSGIDPGDPFNTTSALLAFLKAFCGGALFWLTGFIISDIILKGAVEDIPHEAVEPLEGGLIQRIHATQSEPRVIDRAEAERTQKTEEKKKEAKGKKSK
jgi:hypothetical protein